MVCLCPINEKKYVTADETTFHIWEISETKKLVGSQKFEGEKISKIVYCNEKLMVATVIEQMYVDF